MPVKLQIVAAIAVFTAQNVVENYQLRKKFKLAARGFLAATEENQLLKEKMNYLFHMLEENDVTFDEFDLIALTHDIPQD